MLKQYYLKLIVNNVCIVDFICLNNSFPQNFMILKTNYLSKLNNKNNNKNINFLLPNIKFYYNYLIYNNYNYYKPFHLKLNTMYKRLKSKKNVKEINEKKLIKSVDDKLDLAHNRIKFFDNSVSLLFGYKLQFNGRFTRKQKSANV